MNLKFKNNVWRCCPLDNLITENIRLSMPYPMYTCVLSLSENESSSLWLKHACYGSWSTVYADWNFWLVHLLILPHLMSESHRNQLSCQLNLFNHLGLWLPPLFVITMTLLLTVVRIVLSLPIYWCYSFYKSILKLIVKRRCLLCETYNNLRSL
jgi:hypothetical protein